MSSTKDRPITKQRNYPDLKPKVPVLSDSAGVRVSSLGGQHMKKPPAAEAATRTSTLSRRDRLLLDAYDWLYFVATEWRLQDAEDIVQEALMRAIAAWPQIGEWRQEQQRAWLKKVALRVLLNERRSADVGERNRFNPTLQWLMEGPPPPTDVADAADARKSRARLLSKLAADDRLILHVWAEQHERQLSVADAARKLHLTLDEYAAAKRRIGRTLRRHAETERLTLSDIMAQPTPRQCECCSKAGERSDDNE